MPFLHLDQMLRNCSRRARLNCDVINAANVTAILVLCFGNVSHTNWIPISQEHRINLPVNLGYLINVNIGHDAR